MHSDVTFLTYHTPSELQGELKGLQKQANFLAVSSECMTDGREPGKGDTICALLGGRWHSRPKARRICLWPLSINYSHRCKAPVIFPRHTPWVLISWSKTPSLPKSWEPDSAP